MPVFPPPIHRTTSAPTATSAPKSNWVIVGASRGIGLEFVRQLLARGDQVIAAVRDPYRASELWQFAAGQGAGSKPGACVIHQCDVTDEGSINAWVERMQAIPGLKIDHLVLNAGILKYPNRATEISFLDFALHLSTNAIGPIIIAQKFLSATSVQSPPPSSSASSSDVSSWQQKIPIKTIAFMSSDSGSTVQFRNFEDGFGAYAASKAALNQMLRHMAAELKRKGERPETTVLALHPGEVQTDMANISVDWEVEGIISPEESVRGLIQVIESKGPEQSGTFWTWDGREHPW